MDESNKWILKGKWIDFRNGDIDEELYKVASTPGDICEFEGVRIVFKSLDN